MADMISNANSTSIETEKVQRMLARLIMREKNNLQTREKSDAQMVQMIKKMIEEEVQCY
ncbi:MAG: hypothetical protein FWH57_09025 [Oscillospiraceae bacterium]|nr:hypothetical protein [Oscillospiraceae bacterium]